MFALRFLRSHRYALLCAVIGAAFAGLLTAPLSLLGGVVGAAIGNYFDFDSR